MVSSETSASSNLGRLIASHAGNCPKIRGSLHSPIAGPGLPMITKSSSKKLSVVTRKRTARPQKMPKWRRSALPWALAMARLPNKKCGGTGLK